MVIMFLDPLLSTDMYQGQYRHIDWMFKYHWSSPTTYLLQQLRFWIHDCVFCPESDYRHGPGPLQDSRLQNLDHDIIFSS